MPHSEVATSCHTYLLILQEAPDAPDEDPKLKPPVGTSKESAETVEESKLETQIVMHATSRPEHPFTVSGNEVNTSDLPGMFDANGVKWEGGSLDLQSTMKLPRRVYKKSKCHTSLDSERTVMWIVQVVLQT